jgi:hypothetical protein
MSTLLRGRRELGELDASLPRFSVRTMDEVVADNAQGQRFTSLLVGSFATLAVGVAGALAAGRVVASLLHEVKPGDLPVLLLTAGLLIAVALAASWLPARRAANLDPMTALRYE